MPQIFQIPGTSENYLLSFLSSSSSSICSFCSCLHTGIYKSPTPLHFTANTMNFLSSAISSLTGTSIPYTFKEKIVDPQSGSYPDSRSIWTVYNGVNPKTDTPVTIFEYVAKDPANVQKGYEPLARNCFRKSKLIKFPGIISVVDFIESETHVYIVTERVTPLAHYLTENAGKVLADAKLYGIHGIAHALLFVNMKAQCLHGNLNVSSSVFVNAQGEWKLFGFELLTNLQSDPDQPIYRLSQSMPGFKENLPDEVINGGIDAIRQFAIKYDSYRLGHFIFSVLTRQSFDRNVVVEHSELLAGSNKIPKQIALQVKRLVSAKPNLRITVEKFVQETEAYFSENSLVAFSKILEDMKFSNEADKLAFFKNELAHYVDGEFPPGYLDNKLLPEIISQFNNLANTKPTVNSTPEQHQQRQETMSVLLNFVLKLSSALSDEKFTKTIKPIIFHAFTLSDRSIRLILLSHLPSYSQRLADYEVQLKIFYNLISGFQDTNFTIRETTLTSITTVIEKVSVKQVNQDLLKVLAKLQMDPKPLIRTNTLILIIKISSKIYTTSRNSVVITALAKSLRDTFTPCKITALHGFEKLIDQFSLDEICGKILGHLAVALMDPKSAKVRSEAKRIFQLYLGSVEKHAAGLPADEEDEDAEEKEFFRLNAPESSGGEDPKAVSAPKNASSFSLGWMNKLVSSEVDGTLNKSFDRSTPDLTRVSTPKTEPENWDDLVENDGWSDEDVAPKVEDPARAVPRKPSTTEPKKGLRFGAQLKPVAKPQTKGLQLGQRLQKKPGSTLKLDLAIEDNDDESWGGEW